MFNSFDAFTWSIQLGQNHKSSVIGGFSNSLRQLKKDIFSSDCFSVLLRDYFNLLKLNSFKLSSENLASI